MDTSILQQLIELLSLANLAQSLLALALAVVCAVAACGDANSPISPTDPREGTPRSWSVPKSRPVAATNRRWLSVGSTTTRAM